MNNDLKVIKKHFSKLGLMYFVGILLFYIIQVAAAFIAEAIAGSEILMDSDISFWIMMLPMYIIGYPIMILLVKRVPIEQDIPKRKRFSTVICNVGMILFCGFELINIVFQLFQ